MQAHERTQDNVPGQPALVDSDVAVRMRGIVKRYGVTLANDGVDFDLAAGEIHALLGENGAGKTTLMNVLFGLVRPDAGEIRLSGRRVELRSPHEALDLGVGMVHQHFMLVPKFTVAENVVLGAPFNRGPMLPRAEAERRVSETAARFGIDVDPRQVVGELPVETKQRVEILKLLYRGATTLILDEPTSVLGPAQIEALFKTLTALRETGTSVVIVTHKLSEVMSVAQRVTVLRHGRNVATAGEGTYDEKQLARAMIGHDVEDLPARTASGRTSDRPLLKVERLAVDDSSGHRVVDEMNFELAPGEILGVAGVAGNGQRELIYALAGVLDVAAGRIELDGQDVSAAEPRARRAAGLGVIPEDRHRWGLALDMTVAENLAIARVAAGELKRRGVLNLERLRPHWRELLEAYDVRPAEPGLSARSLSGGNQQKVVLARELSAHPEVLVAAAPTQGLDVGAADFVLRQLLELRNSGGSVLLVSSDLDELKRVADRFIVLYRGRIAYQAGADEASTHAMAMAMAGGRSEAYNRMAEGL